CGLMFLGTKRCIRLRGILPRRVDTARPGSPGPAVRPMVRPIAPRTPDRTRSRPMMNSLPDIYVGNDAVIVRLDMGQRRVRAIVSREALEERFSAQHNPAAWLDAYKANSAVIDAVVRDKVAKASPEPVIISKYDF
ncbi:MAG: DUF1488 family protein, partial [Aquabacterium sp.]